MARTEVTGSQIKDGTVSLTADVTGTLLVANGGTGSTTLALNNVLLGNGTGALQAVAPGTAANVLRSNGTTWASTALTKSDVGLGSVDNTADAAKAVLSATKLTTARTIAVSGAVTGTATSFDGSANITIPTTVSATQGGVVYGSSATAYASTAAGTAGYVLASGGTGAPTWVANDLTAFPLSAFKQAAKVATTAAITLSGTQTIDGIAVVAGDRVLVKDQATAATNGVYTVSATTWTRTTDADTADKIAGALIPVDQGTANGGLLFTATFKPTDTLGTTAMPFYRIYTTLDAATANTASKLVLRDASGNFSAGTITAALSGNATTATTATYTTSGIAPNTSTYLNARVIQNGNTTTYTDGLYLGYGNASSGATRLYGGGDTTTNVSIGTGGTLTASGTVSGTRLISTIATGTAPLTVSSTTVVTNLNADLLDGYNTSTTAAASTVAVRDSNNNLLADNFIPTATSTATAAGITTLDITATQIQVFTGTLTQTVKLPTTGVLAGQSYTIVNNSTGAVAVQSSAGNAITSLAASTTGIFTAIVSTPTTDAHWVGNALTAGRIFKATNDLTLTGTDGTTMTFPTTNATIARTDAAQTFTGVQTMTSPALTTPAITGTITGTYSFGGTPTWPTFNQNTTGTAANVTGTVAVANGGTGATTLTGLVKGNGTTAMTAAVAGTDYVAPTGTINLGTTAVTLNRASGALTLAGITLTNPVIGQINDTNGNTAAWFGGTASAVNFMQMGNAAVGGRPLLRAQGSDTNVGLAIAPKGTGSVVLQDGAFKFVLDTAGITNAVNYLTMANAITATDPYLLATGTDTNIGLNLRTKGTGTVKINAVDAVTVSGAQTITDKRVTPRIGSTASTATPSIDCGLYDQYNITALAIAITGVTVTGTPTDGQRLMVRIKGDATPRAITWGASFTASGVAPLLATTVASKTHLCSFLYDSAAAKWVAVATDDAGY